MAPTIWIDVEDYFDYFIANPRPSGIQRLSFEIMRALREREGERVRFVSRASGGEPPLREVPWEEVATRHERRPATPRPAPAAPKVPTYRLKRQIFEAILAMPPELQSPLLRAGPMQTQAAKHWAELLRALRRRPDRRPAPPPIVAGEGQQSFAARVRPGDLFLVLGAPWAVPGFPALLETVKRRYGLEAHLLLYDLIPVRHPEWCTVEAVALFEAWLDASLPLFDGLMSISRHTAEDVAAYARERGLPIAAPIRPIPIGSGLPMSSGGAPSADLPPAGSYALFVSTLEARKNHALAVRVWWRLQEEVRTGRRSSTSVPDLVFAGRVGWLVSDLLQQLENTGWLRGRVRLIPDPTDADLQALYAGCRFTFFPSWFEGWGLPVTESLAFGKPCLASSATALPEAGGALCTYFDPASTADALASVKAVIDDPAALPAWEDRIRRSFRPTPWSATAGAVLEHLAADQPSDVVAA